MDVKAMEAIVNQLKATEALANGQPAKPGAKGGANGGFAESLRHAVDAVNSEEMKAGNMVDAQSSGHSQVDINQIMVALEKADLSFQAMVEVRNKLVSAYQKIMNLQV